MSCAPRVAEQIDPVHASQCLACTRALAEQRALQAQLARLPAPTLGRERRQALAAEVMARADLRDDTRALRRPRIGRYVIGALAAAAVAFVLVRSERGLSDRVERRTIAAATFAPPPLEPTANEPAPRAVPRVESAFETRAVEGPEVEAPAVEAPVVDAGEPRRVPGRARQVFGAGADKHRTVIDRDSLVEDSPLAAFRAGWEALRAQRYADAIAAFDRATDPAVAEDAAFWAAIAAQRAGQPDDARKRLDLFLATFPESPRAESARRAREVLR